MNKKFTCAGKFSPPSKEKKVYRVYGGGGSVPGSKALYIDKESLERLFKSGEEEVIMNKREVQKRVLQNGRPLALSQFTWCKKTKTFSSDEDFLVIDFTGVDGVCVNAGNGCTITTEDGCTIKAGSDCTITTGGYCTITTEDDCTITAEWDCAITAGRDSVIINRNLFEVIQPKAGQVIQICPVGVAGHLVDGVLANKGE